METALAKGGLTINDIREMRVRLFGLADAGAVVGGKTDSMVTRQELLMLIETIQTYADLLGMSFELAYQVYNSDEVIYEMKDTIFLRGAKYDIETSMPINGETTFKGLKGLTHPFTKALEYSKRELAHMLGISVDEIKDNTKFSDLAKKAAKKQFPNMKADERKHEEEKILEKIIDMVSRNYLKWAIFSLLPKDIYEPLVNQVLPQFKGEANGDGILAYYGVKKKTAGANDSTESTKKPDEKPTTEKAEKMKQEAIETLITSGMDEVNTLKSSLRTKLQSKETNKDDVLKAIDALIAKASDNDKTQLRALRAAVEGGLGQ